MTYSVPREYANIIKRADLVWVNFQNNTKPNVARNAERNGL